MATLFILQLYQVVWLELHSFVTSGFHFPSTVIVLKVKLGNILSTLCMPFNLLPLLDHSGDLTAYWEQESFTTKAYICGRGTHPSRD